jgi:ribosome biogenesis GTPase
LREKESPLESPTRGRVVRIDRKQIHVAVAGGDGVTLVVPCVVRGRFFEGMDDDPESRPVAVGDFVNVVLEEETSAERRGVIVEVLPRSTRIARPRPRNPQSWQVIAANVDLLGIVVSLKDPPPRAGFVDRVLVMAESGKIEPLIVLNKVDLVPATEAEAFSAPWRELGYRVLATSATSGAGVEELRDAMRGRTAMLLGHSGVGKSSLLVRLDPTIAARIGDLVASGTKMARGAHTTTSASLHRLEFGADLVDTPGVREFGLPPMEKHDLAHWFRDLAPRIPGCRYATCIHDHEPSCAVKAAVERGEIRRERYDSYLKLLAELSGGGERMQRHDAY